MSLSEEYQKLIMNLQNSYSACREKGAFIPDKQCFDNLANCISSIKGGGNSTVVKNYIRGLVQSFTVKGVTIKNQVSGSINSSVTTNIDYSTYWKSIGELTEVSESTYIGFSNSNYLQYLDQSQVTSSDTGTLYLTIETGSDITTHQSLIGTQEGDNKFAIGIGDGMFYLIDKRNGVSEENCTTTGCEVKANTGYNIKILFHNNYISLAYTYTYSDELIDTITRAFTQPLNLILGKGYAKDSEWSGFLGSIITTDSKLIFERT